MRFPDICQDAAVLGVNRVSLFRALTGKWNIPGLVARYERLKAQQAANQAKESPTQGAAATEEKAA